MNTEEKLVINGGNKLKGEVNIHGSKNAAVALVAAALLVEGKVTIENIPEIDDVSTLLDAIVELGGIIEHISHDIVSIDCSTITKSKADNYNARQRLLGGAVL